MTTTYSSILSTDLDHVRFLIQDTETPFEFQDEEIDAVLADETATGQGLKYYAAARLLEVVFGRISTSRGTGDVREKRVGKLTLIWGVDRDTLEALNARISALRVRGGYLVASTSKVFRVITPGNRTV